VKTSIFGLAVAAVVLAPVLLGADPRTRLETEFNYDQQLYVFCCREVETHPGPAILAERNSLEARLLVLTTELTDLGLGIPPPPPGQNGPGPELAAAAVRTGASVPDSASTILLLTGGLIACAAARFGGPRGPGAP
jgi:hypothetical protein